MVTLSQHRITASVSGMPTSEDTRGVGKVPLGSRMREPLVLEPPCGVTLSLSR